MEQVHELIRIQTQPHRASPHRALPFLNHTVNGVTAISSAPLLRKTLPSPI
ncbi:hypothetical protein Lalb_Chr23g0275631 [Lupinus albus]|uniref:Uncharacterized protein n=1 Tax=Lupinus albus TaxID=3870 RepID=A0A6A4NM15_LUPAL|nr:hypothetical protein Lalb_Chr23g0275631 [Lupinus albus]